MSDGLQPFRRRLDVLDTEIARLFGERFDVCRGVARYKSEHGIAMMQPDRVAEVRSRYLARGAEVNLPESFTSELFELVIGATCRMEDELMETPEIKRVDFGERGHLGLGRLSERRSLAGRARGSAKAKAGSR